MITPLDIESKEFGSAFVGYRKKEVQTFLKEVLTTYERMYKENIELKDKVNMLNEGIQYYKTIEETLQNTLLLAEKTAEETRSSSRRKGESIEKEAEIKASKLLDEAKHEVHKINQAREAMVKAYDASKIQIKQFLNVQLELIEKSELELNVEDVLAKGMLDSIRAHEESTTSKKIHVAEVKEDKILVSEEA